MIFFFFEGDILITIKVRVMLVSISIKVIVRLNEVVLFAYLFKFNEYEKLF